MMITMRLSTKLWMAWMLMRGRVIRTEADVTYNTITLTFENSADARRRLQR